MAMGTVKVFLVRGVIEKPNWQTEFRKEVRATKPEEAVEKTYCEFGSRHRVKRFQMKILDVQEMPSEAAGSASDLSPSEAGK